MTGDDDNELSPICDDDRNDIDDDFLVEELNKTELDEALQKNAEV